MAIRIFNVATQSEETEIVAGVAGMRFLYETWIGRWLLKAIFCRTWWSRVMGWFANRPMSRRRIEPFVRAQGIDLAEFESTDYPSFNAFFIRRFKDGARSFPADASIFPAFAEARYTVLPIRDLRAPMLIKGQSVDVVGLLDSQEWAQRFDGGACAIARLCPKDYHRFHYPDDGETLEVRRIAGALDSVHPIALARKPHILIRNERVVSLLKTRNFGTLAYVEVGALGVGKIVQTHSLDMPFKRGAEKGYFLFGGSTVVVLTEAGRVRFPEELLARTMETWVPLGHPLGQV